MKPKKHCVDCRHYSKRRHGMMSACYIPMDEIDPESGSRRLRHHLPYVKNDDGQCVDFRRAGWFQRQMNRW